jgi:hypothetical protein
MGRITLKAGKTYRLEGDIGMINCSSANNGYVLYNWYNADTNSPLNGGHIEGHASCGNNFTSSSVQDVRKAEVIYTPTSDTRVELRFAAPFNFSGYGNNSLSANDSPSVYIETLTSPQPTTQTVDYVSVKTTDQTGFGSGVDVDMASVNSGNLPVDLTGNTITLYAGKTYHLVANLRLYAGSTDGEYGWVDSTNAELVPNFGRGHVCLDGCTQNGDSFADVVYTPTTNTLVKVRGLNGTANWQFEARASSITVTQVGSNATTEYATIN